MTSVDFMMSPLASSRDRPHKRVGVGLAGADAHRLIDRGDENLAVADLAGLGGADDGVDHLVDAVGRHRHLDPDLGQEVHRVFGAAVDFGVALLAAVAFDLGHGHAVHADRDQRVADFLELEWLDDGDDQFHGLPSRGPLTDRISVSAFGSARRAGLAERDQPAHDIGIAVKN